MKIEWSPRANSNLDRIFEYILVHDPMAAIRMLDTIRSRVDLLRDQPGLGRPGQIIGTRELVITDTPYIVAYRIINQSDRIQVLAVIHGAQLWPDELG